MTAPRLSVGDLTVRLAGRDIITHLDWTVRSGEFVALIGPNGVGKTTLLRSILGLIPRAGGNITVDGEHASRVRGVLGYVPQKHHFAWDFPLTVEDAVMSGRTRSMGWLRRPRVADWRRVNQAIERADLGRLRRRPIGELSGGQRQRVLLARVLANEPKVLLLDEPFTGVDVPTQDMLVELYRQLADDGLGIVMSTHDVLGALDDCSRICGLRGRIALDVDPADAGPEYLNAWLRGREDSVPRPAAETTKARPE